MSCHHRHGPWCYDDYYNSPPAYRAQNYAPAPQQYPPRGYAPVPPESRRPTPHRDQEELSSYLEYLESELAQVRERIATTNPDAEKTN